MNIDNVVYAKDMHEFVSLNFSDYFDYFGRIGKLGI